MFSTHDLLKYAAIWQALSYTAATQSVTPAIGIPSTLSTTVASPSPSGLATSLVFVPWDDDVSVVAIESTATTYVVNATEPSASPNPSCNVEAFDQVTIVNGPSTAAVTYIFTSCGTNPATSYHIACPLTSPYTTATCDYVLSMGNTTTTTTVTQNQSELSAQPCTITGGLELLSDAGVTGSMTTQAGIVPQTTMPTASQTGSTTQSTGTPAQTSPIQNTNGAESLFSASWKVVVSACAASVVLLAV